MATYYYESVPSESGGLKHHVDHGEVIKRIRRQRSASVNKQRRSLICMLVSVATLFVVIAVVIALSVVMLMNRDSNKITSPSESDSFKCNSPECRERVSLVRSFMDSKVDPCQDFYQYACGQFANYVPREFVGKTTRIVTDLVYERMKKVLIEALESNASQNETSWETYDKTRAVFGACIHSDEVSNKGVLDKMLAELGGFHLAGPVDNEPLPPFAETLAKAHTFSKMILFTLEFASLISTPTTLKMAVSLNPKTKTFPASRVTEIFRKFIIANQTLRVQESLDEAVSKTIEFGSRLSTALAKENHESSGSYVLYSVEELVREYPSIDWPTFFAQISKIAQTDVQVSHVKIIDKAKLQSLDSLIANFSRTDAGRRVLHNFLVFQALFPYYKYADASLEHPPLKVLENDCLNQTIYELPFAIASLAERLFPIEDNSRFKMTSIFTETMKTIFSLVKASNYTEESKQRFEQRLKTLRFQFGSPDWMSQQRALDDYHSSFVATNSSVQNALNAYRFRLRHHITALGKSAEDVDKPKSVLQNGAYTVEGPSYVKTVLPQLTLQPPIFNPTFPDFFNVATFGKLIAHELHHILSEEFFKSDNFTSEIGSCVRDFYGKFQYNGLTFPSFRTTREDLADIAAADIAFRVYRSLLSNNRPNARPYNLPLSVDQLFFVSAAQLECVAFSHRKMVMDFTRETLTHSPGPFRVNGAFANLEAFAAAFQCPLDTQMNPGKRCTVF